MSFKIRVLRDGSVTRIYISNKKEEGFTIWNRHKKWEFSHFWRGGGAVREDVEEISVKELAEIIDLNELLELL